MCVYCESERTYPFFLIVHEHFLHGDNSLCFLTPSLEHFTATVNPHVSETKHGKSSTKVIRREEWDLKTAAT